MRRAFIGLTQANPAAVTPTPLFYNTQGKERRNGERMEEFVHRELPDHFVKKAFIVSLGAKLASEWNIYKAV